MLKNFFKIAFRNLSRHKGFSAINIVGLAIGMASALLIGLWIRNEISVDRFYPNTSRIYELYSRENDNGKMDAWFRTATPMTAELKRSYPEVEDAVRFRTVYFLMTEGEKHLNLEGAFVDSGFLSVFGFPMLEGDPKSALADKQSIVLTKPLAKSLFGNEDPIGKTVRIDSTDYFSVTGVLKDLPPNTEFTFQYLLPRAYLDKLRWDEQSGTWEDTDASTYVLLRPGASEAAFDAKVRYIVHRHVPEGEGSTRETFTQPLSRAHLYSKVEDGRLVGGRIQVVGLFATIAIFILLIACINFMNLSTARSAKRAREVGIRKVVGAHRISLIVQFIGESILIAAIAFVLALGLVQIGLGAFDEVLGIPLSIDWTDPAFWTFSIGFILFTGVVAGSYPAFFLSSARPVKVLKGTVKRASSLVQARKVLVVLQFTFAIVLITCTLIVQRQIKYARNRDSGYNRDRLAYTFAEGDVLPHYAAIKQELLSSGAAVGVTKTFSPMTRIWGEVTGCSWPGSSPSDKSLYFTQFEADADFIKTTGTHLLEGRDIDLANHRTDSTALLLNETAVKTMRLSHPLGSIVTDDQGIRLHVVGVIKDFLIDNPYEAIKPMMIRGLSTTYPVIHFRLNPSRPITDDLALAEKVFQRYNPQYPFEYYFVDDAYNAKFKTEQQTETLASLFAGLAIFISCLGLFGLATYIAESRTREIGVRKVLGASVSNIAVLISGDFVNLVLVAVAIATPIAWFAMHSWLQGYSYRIQMSVWIFALAGILAIGIALLTVSFQAIKSSLANPVNSLRSE